MVKAEFSRFQRASTIFASGSRRGPSIGRFGHMLFEDANNDIVDWIEPQLFRPQHTDGAYSQNPEALMCQLSIFFLTLKLKREDLLFSFRSILSVCGLNLKLWITLSRLPSMASHGVNFILRLDVTSQLKKIQFGYVWGEIFSFKGSAKNFAINKIAGTGGRCFKHSTYRLVQRCISF